jgi:hypothetical protein
LYTWNWAGIWEDGKEEEQLYALKKYVEYDPQNIEANKYIGIILTRRGQVNEE